MMAACGPGRLGTQLAVMCGKKSNKSVFKVGAADPAGALNHSANVSLETRYIHPSYIAPSVGVPVVFVLCVLRAFRALHATVLASLLPRYGLGF
jgi:hypothetical protein